MNFSTLRSQSTYEYIHYHICICQHCFVADLYFAVQNMNGSTKFHYYTKHKVT